jgi:hypothetical protein
MLFLVPATNGFAKGDPFSFTQLRSPKFAKQIFGDTIPESWVKVYFRVLTYLCTHLSHHYSKIPRIFSLHSMAQNWSTNECTHKFVHIIDVLVVSKSLTPMSNGKSPIYRWTPYIFSKKRFKQYFPDQLVGLIPKSEVESGNHGSLWFLYRETRFTQRLSPNPPRDDQLGSQGVSAGVLGRLPKSWDPKIPSIVGGQYLDHANLYPDHPWTS